MKTAISLPRETYEAATRRAAELGISRSEFFAVAAQRYLDDLDGASLTALINEAVERDGSDESALDAVRSGRQRLAENDDW